MCICFAWGGTRVEAQKKDPVAMYGVIDTVQVVSQRVRHANEANAGAKVSRIDPEIMRANKTRSLAELLTDYTAIILKVREWEPCQRHPSEGPVPRRLG